MSYLQWGILSSHATFVKSRNSSIAGVRSASPASHSLWRTSLDIVAALMLQRLMANLTAEPWCALKRSPTWTVQTSSWQDGRDGSGRLQERSSTSGKKSHDSGSSGGGQLSVELLQNRGCRSGPVFFVRFLPCFFPPPPLAENSHCRHQAWKECNYLTLHTIVDCIYNTHCYFTIR